MGGRPNRTEPSNGHCQILLSDATKLPRGLETPVKVLFRQSAVLSWNDAYTRPRFWQKLKQFLATFVCSLWLTEPKMGTCTSGRSGQTKSPMFHRFLFKYNNGLTLLITTLHQCTSPSVSVSIIIIIIINLCFSGRRSPTRLWLSVSIWFRLALADWQVVCCGRSAAVHFCATVRQFHYVWLMTRYTL